MGIFLKIWNSRLNPFGNYDEPIPPPWVFLKFVKYRGHKILAYLYWYFWRNPLHNFTHYWIGTKFFPSKWKTWHDKRCFNLILPFFSFKKQIGKRILSFYIGWRPKDDGSQAFGFSIRFSKQA